MSVSSQKKTTTTTYRTVNVASPEPVTSTVISAAPVSPLPYAMNGSYETVRYLVPMQQTIQQPSYILMQQPMVQQMVSPVYLHSMPHLSVSSQESTDLMYQQQSTVESISGKSSSVFSQSSSPIKSPEPSAEEEEEEEVEEEEEEEEEDVEEEEDGETVEVEEVEVVNVIQQRAAPPPAIGKISRMEVRTEEREAPQPAKMDTRYFGELLADVYRKNCDIHSCISEHVSKIRGKKHQLDPSNDYKVEREEVEALLPKGATELTKQQIRYLLQTRLTADKSMRLLLSTFSSLREELLHMSEDLRRLESEKEGLERDLSFKADQAKQYDCLLEAMRENNRQLQVSLKETTATQRALESQLLSSKNNDSSRDFKIKEMEGRMRALEKENEMLRQKLAGQSSSTTLHIKTEELSRQYKDQLSSMKQEKDAEIQRLKNQITKITTTTTTTSEKSSSEKSLQLKISELLAMLEQRQTTITRQEEEIRKLMQERNDSSKSQVTKTIITKRYRNQYPILGLLSDDYQVTSPVKEAKTIVIERTGEMIKQEIITTP
ncbi:protein POF1B isoform X1 [Epinephelus fuscoguttatus]|uniref:protein POF1B isoform X1 n=2 Tax=Epinephelus fuscoguttatus TaxID=293821 RepID=UPI0020D16D85|nr:protein POF1B isoform X1 [Epinephelus fuscoguttatus]